MSAFKAQMGDNMSAFLGPIHHWLYNKIKVQQDIVNDIILLNQNLCVLETDMQSELDNRYGIFDTRPLEEIIDTGNIHGWLQARVSQVEYKLAYIATQLLDKKPDLVKKLEQLFQHKGEEVSLSVSTNSAPEIFKAISDSLLDGMPCDHANSLLVSDETKVVWKRNICVHRSYWDEVGGDINNYYKFREAFIRGFICDKPFTFEIIDDVTNTIKRSEVG